MSLNELAYLNDFFLIYIYMSLNKDYLDDFFLIDDDEKNDKIKAQNIAVVSILMVLAIGAILLLILII